MLNWQTRKRIARLLVFSLCNIIAEEGMFKFIRLLAALMFMLTGVSYASDSVDLKVTATLEAAACSPTLSNGGEAKFGHIALGNLSETQTNQLGSQYLTLTITCSESTPVGWFITDNKKDSVQALQIKNPKYNGSDLSEVDYEFGLGNTSTGTKIGAYAIYVDRNNLTADGNKMTMVYKSGTGNWVVSGAGEIKNDSNYIYAGEASGTADMVITSAKTFVWPLKITAAIQPVNVLDISDDTPLTGSATFTLKYL